MSDQFRAPDPSYGAAPRPVEPLPPAEVTGQPSRVVVVPPSVPMVALLGPHDQLLATMERNLPSVEIFVRGNQIHLLGPELELDLAERLLDELLTIAATGQQLNRDAVERSIRMLREHVRERPADVLTMNIVSNRGRTIRPKTVGQKRYVDAIEAHTIVFGIGPAGTGRPIWRWPRRSRRCRPRPSTGSS